MPDSQMNHSFDLIGQTDLQKALRSKKDNSASEGDFMAQRHIQWSAQTELVTSKGPSEWEILKVQMMDTVLPIFISVGLIAWRKSLLYWLWADDRSEFEETVG